MLQAIAEFVALNAPCGGYARSGPAFFKTMSPHTISPERYPQPTGRVGISRYAPVGPGHFTRNPKAGLHFAQILLLKKDLAIP
jgi:hypothetical protein